MKLFIKEQIEAINGVIAVTDIQISKTKDSQERHVFVINANVKTEYSERENIIEVLQG